MEPYRVGQLLLNLSCSRLAKYKGTNRKVVKLCTGELCVLGSCVVRYSGILFVF